METYTRISRHFASVREIYLDAWGEPLLNPNIWEMAAMAKRDDRSVGVTTNGTLLDEQATRQVLRLVDVLAVSIDGATRDTYEKIRIGADFGQVVDSVKALVDAREQAEQETPFISLLFIKMKENIAELPAFVDLAAALGVDEVIASNLSYLPTPSVYERKVFSYDAPPQDFTDFVEEACVRADGHDLLFQVYPLQPRSVPYCEASPLEELYITWDGQVSPCVYLNLPLEGNGIPRVHRGERVSVPRTSFGNIGEEDLEAIWATAAYRDFRDRFAARVHSCYQTDGYTCFGRTDDGRFQDVSEKARQRLRHLPLPPVCRSCYKGRGI